MLRVLNKVTTTDANANPHHQRKEAYVRCPVSKTESKTLQPKERLMGSLKVGWPEWASCA